MPIRARRNNTSTEVSVDLVSVDAGPEFARAGPSVVEVWALYGGRVLDVQHLSRAASTRAASDCYTIGESHHVALVVPPAGLPQGHAFALVRGRTLNFTASMRGEVRCDGETLSLHALVRDGHATLCGSTYRYGLRPGARCRVEHGAVTFFVNVVPPEEPIRLDFQTCRRFWVSNARALVLAASVLVPVYLATPSTGEADVEIDERLGRDVVVAFARRPTPGEPKPELAAEPVRVAPGAGPDSATMQDRFGAGGGDGEGQGLGSAADPRGGETSAAQGRRRGRGEGSEAGGDAEASRWVRIGNSALCQPLDLLAVEARAYTHPTMPMRVGPCRTPEAGGIPQMARNFDPDIMARQAGIMGALQTREGHFLAMPPGRAFAVGSGDEDIWGGFTGTEVGGRTTAGRRGGERRGLAVGPRSPLSTRVRLAKEQIRGRFDRDIIRRIVRTHIDEVDHCYGGGLSRRPGIRGRVTIEFTIRADGRVPTSKVARSSLGDKPVENCISAATRRWTFPKPADGNVAVTIPFVLGPR